MIVLIVLKYNIKKNYLDEMQERKLLQIEYNGCWMAFWGMLIVLVGQMLLFPDRMSLMAGEWVVFMLLALYLGIASVRNGIWERKIPASHRANLLVSAIAALVTGGIIDTLMWRTAGNWQAVAVSGVSTVVATFLLCLLALTGTMWACKRRRNQLDDSIREE